MEHEERTQTDEPTNPQAPQQEGAAPQQGAEASSEHHGMAGIVGIIIVVLIVALGGLYLWTASDSRITPPSTQPEVPGMPDVDPIAEEMGTQSDSDELSEIEADLIGTDLDALDADLDALELELQTEAQTSAELE